jgi:DNA replication protein DnaC
MSFAAWDDRGSAVLKNAALAAQELAENRSELPFLFLSGRPGTGRTHLSVAAVKRAQELGSPAKFAYVSYLISELRALMAPDAERSPEEWQRLYQSFPLLALDDLGVQRPTPFADEELDHLIDARYIQRLPTIITTNLNQEKLAERAVRIADRILDRAVSQRFHFDVASYRSGERW